MSRDRRSSIAEFVDYAYQALDQTDYYRVLGVQSLATPGEVQAAYYKLAQSLHPDVHGNVDNDYRLRLTAVFSRVVEAYKVLSDPQKRQLYDETLASGDLRLRAVAPRARSRTLEGSISNASARRFFQLGMAALNDKNGRSAVQNFKLALSMEPDSDIIKTKLQEAEAISKP